MTPAEYFILDALSLLPTPPEHFLHKEWAILFNTPPELPPLSPAERRQALAGLQRRGLLALENGLYRLTAQGGRLWEQLFAADWQHFHDCWFTILDEHRRLLEFSCASRHTLAQFLAAHPELAANPPEPLSRWPATYWKTLPAGFLIRQTVPADFSQTFPPAWSHSLAQVLKQANIVN